MKKVAPILFILSYAVSFSQNVKMEIIDYNKELNGKKYATYEYVNSDYSASRPAIIFVTDIEIFEKICFKIPEFFSLRKQEYTDVYLLGIEGYGQKNSTESDKNIVNLFYQKIVKYRNSNELLEYNIEQLTNQTNTLSTEYDLCKYLACPIPKKRKSKP